jgi:hypothetical protein
MVYIQSRACVIQAAKKKEVTLCGTKLTGVRHICAFFDSAEEQNEVLMPFLKEGIDEGEQVVTILDSATHDDHALRLEAAGISVAAAKAREQLRVLSTEATYTMGNVFVADRMYDMLASTLRDAESTKFKGIRAMGDMAWALRNCPGTEDLLIYEARVNQVAPQHDCTLLCAYDINRFSGRVVADILATHSHVVMGGRVHANPHYVEPLEFLQRVALRRRSEPTARIVE